MSDQQRVAGSQDATRIDINDTYGVRDWCTVLHCSEGQLQDAVRAVGNSAMDVKTYLGNHDQNFSHGTFRTV